MFIFEDSAFRRFYKREPEEIGPGRVLGFLLKEEDEQAPPRGEDVEFVELVPVRKFRAREWSADRKMEVDVPPGLGSKVGAWLLYPFSLLGRFIEWNSGMERGRWPDARSPLVRNLVHSVNGLLGGIHPLLMGVLACVVIAVGALQVISAVSTDQLTTLQATDWTDPRSYVMRPLTVILTLLVIAVAILVVFASLLGIVANFTLLRASRRILYGLVTTYVAGPGASEWVANKRNIISLPIPPTVNTLSFEMTSEKRAGLIASAKQATLAKLAEVLSEENRRANNGMQSDGATRRS